MPPALVQRCFAGLTGAARTALATAFPQAVGRLDGAPPALRYLANRLLMRTGPHRAWEGQFLLYDPRGAGRAALVHGDLCTADRIAVLVPGTGTVLATFLCGLGGLAHRSPAVQAANLHRAAGAARPGAQVAVVAWLGYSAPRGLGRAAAGPDLAVAGAAELVRFARGLVAVRPQSTITVLGHSYGSVVVGLAAGRLPVQVRDIVAVGSPGMGVDHAARLGTAATVWAAEAATDWVRRVPAVRICGVGHGRRPAHPAFGARILPTAGVAGHDRYLSEGSATLAALAAIVAGAHAGGRTSPIS